MKAFSGLYIRVCLNHDPRGVGWNEQIVSGNMVFIGIEVNLKPQKWLGV